LWYFKSEGGNLETFGVAKIDNLGTRYESGDYVLANYNSGLFVSSERKTVSNTYEIDGEYTNFYGAIVLDNNYKNTNLIGVVRVIDEDKDKILFEQDGITKGFLPSKFNIDVTGVQQMTVEFEGYDEFRCLVVNAFLIKCYNGFTKFIVPE